ncbi:MAG: tetratricopeptide repeat protein [Longimicrobiaceae bacterium]
MGTSLLQETDGDLGVVLWRSLRAVCAWASTPPADRPLLFPPGARDQRMADLLVAAPPPALERPLLVLAELLGEPVRIGPDRVGIACLSVAAWAREAGRHATALEFSQAGALVCPGSPSYALAAARESRDAGEHEQAEALYHRAVALARQVRDWDSYVRAHAGLGMLAKGRGAYPAARKSHLRALRAAERHRLGYLRAMMLHELFVVELDCGNAALAERYAGAAVEAYGRGHAMLRVLAFDVAAFWMTRERYGDALPVFLRLLPTLDAEAQVLGWGDVAHAAGGTGEAATFDRAHRHVAAAPADYPRRVDALRETASGALLLGRLELAESLAREVAVLARGCGDHKSVFVAEALLDQVSARRGGAAAPERAVRPAYEPSPTLADSLLRALDAVPA